MYAGLSRRCVDSVISQRLQLNTSGAAQMKDKTKKTKTREPTYEEKDRTVGVCVWVCIASWKR